MYRHYNHNQIILLLLLLYTSIYILYTYLIIIIKNSSMTIIVADEFLISIDYYNQSQINKKIIKSRVPKDMSNRKYYNNTYSQEYIIIDKMHNFIFNGIRQ